MKKIKWIAIPFLAIVAVAIWAAAAKIDVSAFDIPLITSAPKSVGVTPSLLEQAGYTGVRIPASTTKQFLPPVSYFLVNEKTVWMNAKNQQESTNIVAVSIQPIADNSWSYNNRSIANSTFDNIEQARVSVPGYYIVVTGPDREKVTKLAGLIRDNY